MFYKIHGVRALIYHQDTLLILHRSASDKEDSKLWDVPGGAIESGENPSTALKREVLEETGLDNSRCVIKDPFGLIVSDFRKGKLVILVYSCLADTTSVTLNAEHDDYRWETVPKLPEYPMGIILKELYPQLEH